MVENKLKGVTVPKTPKYPPEWKRAVAVEKGPELTWTLCLVLFLMFVEVPAVAYFLMVEQQRTHEDLRQWIGHSEIQRMKRQLDAKAMKETLDGLGDLLRNGAEFQRGGEREDGPDNGHGERAPGDNPRHR